MKKGVVEKRVGGVDDGFLVGRRRGWMTKSVTIFETVFYVFDMYI